MRAKSRLNESAEFVSRFLKHGKNSRMVSLRFLWVRVFAMCSINHHNDGHIAVTVPLPLGVQAALIEASSKKFYKPPYVGPSGWVGIELPLVSDKELALHIREAWRLIAPEKLKASIEPS